MMLKVLDVDGAVRRVQGGWIATGAAVDVRPRALRPRGPGPRGRAAGHAPLPRRRRRAAWSCCGATSTTRSPSPAVAATCAPARGTRPTCRHRRRRRPATPSIGPASISRHAPSGRPGWTRSGVGVKGKVAAGEQMADGRAVARLSDIGWGTRLRELVGPGANVDAPVTPAVVNAVVAVLKTWGWAQRPVAVVAMPSRTRPQLIATLAERIARRRRLRHQLRRPADAFQPLLRDVKPHGRGWSRSCSARCPPASGQRGKYRFDQQGAAALDGARARRCLSRRGLADAARPRATPRPRGRLDGAEPDFVSDRAFGPRRRPVRHARLGQPLPRGAGRRSRLRRGGRRRDGPGEGHGLRDDPLAARAAWAIRSATTPWPSSAGVPEKYGIDLPDRQLACAPVDSPEGQHYLGAMRAAANYAWCNRQLLMWQAREVLRRRSSAGSWEELQMNLIYDVAHNIAKFEEHTIGGTPEAGLGASQGGDAGLPAGPPRDPDAVPQDRPAGDHPRRHGPGQLGAGRPAGQHGADVRHDLPRRRPRDEPHRRRQARRAAAASTRSWTPAASSPAPAAGRAWPKNSPTPTRTSTWSSKSSTRPAWPTRSPACRRSA